MKCPYCGELADKTNGRKVYPHRPDLHHHVIFACLPCDAWVGTHKGTDKPLGRLANAELRKAKMAAHSAFDPLWKSGRMSRKDAYAMLSEKMGLKPKDTHIGMFDVDQCKQVVAVCHDIAMPHQPGTFMVYA